jgi:hypothetical protein
MRDEESHPAIVVTLLITEHGGSGGVNLKKDPLVQGVHYRA